MFCNEHSYLTEEPKISHPQQHSSGVGGGDYCQDDSPLALVIESIRDAPTEAFVGENSRIGVVAGYHHVRSSVHGCRSAHHLCRSFGKTRLAKKAPTRPYLFAPSAMVFPSAPPYDELTSTRPLLKKNVMYPVNPPLNNPRTTFDALSFSCSS